MGEASTTIGINGTYQLEEEGEENGLTRSGEVVSNGGEVKEESQLEDNDSSTSTVRCSEGDNIMDQDLLNGSSENNDNGGESSSNNTQSLSPSSKTNVSNISISDESEVESTTTGSEASPAKRRKPNEKRAEALQRYRHLQATKEPFHQNKSCIKVNIRMTNKGRKVLPMCLSCKHQAGNKGIIPKRDVCRFLSFRMVNYKANYGLTVHGFPDESMCSEVERSIWMPNKVPEGISIERAKYLLVAVSKSFFQLVTQEQETLDYLPQQDNRNIIWRKVVQNLREMCDVCITTIFNFHWTCEKCGFVVCISCFKARKNDLLPKKQEIQGRDEYGWLKCTSSAGSHDLVKLLATQIVGGNALKNVSTKLRQLQLELDIPQEYQLELNNEKTVNTKANNSIDNDVEHDDEEDTDDLMAMMGEEDFGEETEVINGSVPPTENNASKVELTSVETERLYPNLPHKWLCSGKLLRLMDPTHSENIKLFQTQWKMGKPIIVSNVSERLDMNLWAPESFCKEFGDKTSPFINCMTGKIVPGMKMSEFWNGFEYVKKRISDSSGNPMLLKLKDWPPGADFKDMMPSRFKNLMDNLPLGEYTHRTGDFNLAARLPDIFSAPDLGPKMYIAYGSGLHLDKATTNLHLDISDAVNVIVYIGVVKDEDETEKNQHSEAVKEAIKDSDCDKATIDRVEKGELPGALWHIWEAADAKRIRDLLNKVAYERGLKIERHHDPIHDQSWYLDKGLRSRLREEYNVIGYPILQCAGDAIFIPAGAPHQVRNLNNCIKIAEDFVSPENVEHCFRLTEEFRNLTETHSNHEDKLQIKNIVYHSVKDAIAVLSADEQDSNSRQ